MVVSNTFSGEKVSTTEVRNKWNVFITYLENGPEGQATVDGDSNEETDAEESEVTVYRSEEDEWYIFNLDRYDLTDTQKLEYVRELQNRWQIVSNQLHSNETFIVDYAAILKDATSFQLLDYYKSEIIQRYANNDDAADISQYITTITPNTNQSGVTGAADVALRNYFLSYMTIADFYKTHDCIKNGSVDEICSVGLSENNDNFDLALSDLSDKYNVVRTSNVAVNNALIHYTMRLNNILGEDTNES